MNSQFWPEIFICLNEVEKEKLSLGKKSINLDSITESRNKINEIVDQLRLSLEQSLEKEYALQIMFAVVAYLDEQIQSYLLEKGQANWVPLQKDFYGAYNAGTLFYDTIDKLVEEPSVPEIVFSVFYFILRKGFLGKYRDSKVHINKYMDILKDKINIIAPKENVNGIRNVTIMNKKRIQPWHYYAAAGTLSIVVMGILYLTSSL